MTDPNEEKKSRDSTASELMRLLAYVNAYGDDADWWMPKDAADIRKQLEAPCFNNAGKCHDWRNHTPEWVDDNWDNLSVEARFTAWYMANKAAHAEEWD